MKKESFQGTVNMDGILLFFEQNTHLLIGMEIVVILNTLFLVVCRFFVKESKRVKTLSTPHKVAIFIATYNEDKEVIKPTIIAARDCKVEHETVILDGGNRPWVKELCTELEVTYLTRKVNAHAKAGAINDAMNRIDCDIIYTLDADFLAQPWMISSTVHYFDDPAVGLVQSPQAFHNKDAFDYHGGWYEQDLFFRRIQPILNLFGGSFWCGCPTAIRKKALSESGGCMYNTITEDLGTNLKLHWNKWKSVYHNRIIAKGESPSKFKAYWNQRNRWSKGTYQIFKKYWWTILSSKLTMGQKYCYFLCFSYWLGSPIYLAKLVGAVYVGVVHGVNPEHLVFPVIMMLLMKMIFGRYFNLFWTPVHHTLNQLAGLAAMTVFFTNKEQKFVVTPKSGKKIK